MYREGMAIATASFNRALFEELCRSEGLKTDSEVARALGVQSSTVLRIRSGENTPSLRFANECRRVFGLDAFVRLFPIPAREEVPHGHE